MDIGMTEFPTSKFVSYFKAVTFRVKKMLHFASKSCYILR